MFVGQACGFPFGEAILQAACLEAARAQCGNGLEGEDTIGAAAIGDDFLLGIEFGKARVEIVQGNVEGAWEMALGKFVRWPDIKNGHEACVRTLQQLLARNWFHRVTVGKISAHDLAYFGDIPFRDMAQGREQGEDGFIAEEIENEFSIPPGGDKTGAPQVLQVLRGIGD